MPSLYRSLWTLLSLWLLATSFAYAGTVTTITNEAKLEELELTVDELTQELDLFNRISSGVRISLSECQNQVIDCPLINKLEMVHLQDTVTRRIDYLQQLDVATTSQTITQYQRFRDTWQDYQSGVEKLLAMLDIFAEDGSIKDIKKVLELLEETLSAYDIGLPEKDEDSELFVQEPPPLAPELEKQLETATENTQ